MNTIRDKAPQARRMADELDALLPRDAPEPQKPTGPSEKERQLAKDLAMLAERNRALMAELKGLRGEAAQQHDGSIATIAELESQISALHTELKAVKKRETTSDDNRIDAFNKRVAELEEDKHELEAETAALRKEAIGHATIQPGTILNRGVITALQKENIDLKEENQKLRAQQEMQAEKIREFGGIIEERDRQLENALTPETLEEVKRTFADAIYNTFKEVDNKNPGFLSSVLANPKISQERKEWIIEAFRANGEEIVL